MKQQYIGAALVALAAICFGLIAIFVKMAYAGQVNTITTLSSRFVLAALFMWLVIRFTKQTVSLSIKEMTSLGIVSLLGYAGAGTFFFASLRTIPSSLAALLLFIHPVIVSLFEVIVYRYPLTIKKLSALTLSTLGLVFVLGNIDGSIDIKGVLLALGGGFCYATYLLYSSKVVQGHSPLVTTTYVLTFAAIIFTLYGITTGGISFAFPVSSWVWLSAMAFISTCLGIISLFAGLKRINAGVAAIIGTFEVVVTVTLSALVFGDVLSMWQLIGAFLIFAGIITLQISPSFKSKTVESYQS